MSDRQQPDDNIIRSEIIEAHDRRVAAVVGYPGFGWTIRRMVCNGVTTRITVEYKGGMRLTESPDLVTLLGRHLEPMPEPPDGWGPNVLQPACWRKAPEGML